MKKVTYVLATLFVCYEFVKVWLSIPVLNLLFIPFSFAMVTFLGFVFQTVFFSWLRKSTAKRNKLIAKITKEKTEEEKAEFFRHYDTEVKPLYERGRNLFTYLMQNGKIRSYQIRDFKKILNSCLGSYIDYYKNHTFENDAKEIYSKMKNFNLDEHDWEKMIDFLENIDNSKPVLKVVK
jgi:hypothetical protein